MTRLSAVVVLLLTHTSIARYLEYDASTDSAMTSRTPLSGSCPQNMTITVSSVFQDHMVLQRNRPIRVWGWGAQGDSGITVTFGSTTAHVTTTDDRWNAVFPPQQANVNGVNLTVSQGGCTIATVADIAIGDVYLFSGQSNIDIPEAYAHQFNEAAQTAEEAYADSLQGRTRIMIVPNQVRGINYNETPARELAVVPNTPACGPSFVSGAYVNCQTNAMRWTRANGTNIRGFSATAWFTGKYIRQQMGAALDGVPIGLVRSSWGGTPIQDWTPAETVSACPQPVQTRTSTLYDWMINPFIGIEWSGITWYQVRLIVSASNVTEDSSNVAHLHTGGIKYGSERKLSGNYCLLHER